MSRLVIVAASFLRYRAEKQTHRQTEVKTLPPRLPSEWVISKKYGLPLVDLPFRLDIASRCNIARRAVPLR